MVLDCQQGRVVRLIAILSLIMIPDMNFILWSRASIQLESD